MSDEVLSERLMSDTSAPQQVENVTMSAADSAVVLGQANRRKDLLSALLFMVLGIGLVLYPYVTGREMPGDLQDNRLILSVLEFFNRAVVALFHGKPANFLNAPFFYPWPWVTEFSDNFWGDGIFYALIRAFRIGPVTSFQMWYVLGFALTYVTAFISFRMIGLRAWGAAAGAFLFTFPLPITDQSHHAQLTYRLWVPPAIVAVDRFLVGPSLRAGAACILFVSLQLATSIYIGLFLCLLLAAYVIALYLVARKRIAPRPWVTFRSAKTAEVITAAFILITGLSLIAVVGIPYLNAEAVYGFARSWQKNVVGAVPRIHSYLLTRFSMLWPNLSYRYHYFHIWEHQMFPGLSAVIGLAWFLFSKHARTRHPLAAPMLVALAILFGITLDLHGHTLYRLIYLIPGFSALREIARVILIMMLPLAVLFGMLIDDLATAGLYQRVRRALAVALSVFVVAECSLIHHYSSSPAEWRRRLANLEARLPPKLPPHAILAVAAAPPPPGVWPLTQVDADVAAVFLGIHTLNGYSGNQPPGWHYMTTCHDIAENLVAGRQFLAEHGFSARLISPDQLVLVGFGPCDLRDVWSDQPNQHRPTRAWRTMAPR